MVSVPEGVNTFRPGDKVYGMPGIRGGAFAEAVSLRPEEVAKKPASLDFIRAAAVPLAALTAWQALFDYGRLAAGERVLVHAGAGGVGSFAVQFAKHAGAYVIATGSGENADFIRQLGADQFIDYQKQ